MEFPVLDYASTYFNFLVLYLKTSHNISESRSLEPEGKQRSSVTETQIER